MTPKDYWDTMTSEEYNAYFAGRYDDVFADQEEWLQENIRRINAQRVLEVGCGAGRFAMTLAHATAYTGYDPSKTMTAVIRRAIRNGLCAELVHEWGEVEGFFDASFTVSVLIHNTQEDAAAIIKRMTDVTQDEVWLIENKLHRGASIKHSDEHNGCWIHDYLSMVPFGWFCKHEDMNRSHDLYVFTPQV